MNKSTAQKFVRHALAVVGAASVLSAPAAFASGLEKSIMFSGKWAPLGGAAASGVTGAEALYFNPAGLAGAPGLNVTGNFSPIFSKFTAPIGTTSYDSTTGFSPSFGAFTSISPMEKWGFGLGVYASGGTTTRYENVLLGPNVTETVRSELTVVEFALGGAYELLDGLRLGVAYRIALAKAALSAPTPAASTTGAAGSALFSNFSNLSDTAWNGFKLGLQYAPRDAKYGFGATWRTQVDFATQGDLDGKLSTGAGGGPLSLPAGQGLALTSGGGGVATSFPTQIQVGGHYDIVEGNRAFAQFDWTEYSVDQALKLNGSLTRTGLPQPIAQTFLPLNYKNTQTYRLGYQNTQLQGWALRAGYALATTASPKGSALAALPPPGSAHTLGLGAGTQFMDGALGVNAGLEYEWANATVEASDQPDIRTYTGEYKVRAYTAHIGVDFKI